MSTTPKAGRLLPQHLADLRRSGLSDETIEVNGIYSEINPTVIARILNWSSPAKALGPCMVIPFADPSTGKLNGFARIRPDNPRTAGGKYEQPRGVSPKPYFPSAAIEAAKTPKAVLGITEGEKKVWHRPKPACHASVYAVFGLGSEVKPTTENVVLSMT